MDLSATFDKAEHDETLERIPFHELAKMVPVQGLFDEDNYVLAPPGLDLANITIVQHGSKPRITGSRIIVKSSEGSIRINIGDDGSRVLIGPQARCNSFNIKLWRDARFTVGAGSYIGGGFALVDDADVAIGDGCLFSAEIALQSNDQHGIVDLTTGQIVNAGRRHISVGDRVWLGRRAVLMPDISIGQGSIIGAGSIVTKDIPAFCIAAGVPAKVIREKMSWVRSENSITDEELSWFGERGFTWP